LPNAAAHGSQQLSAKSGTNRRHGVTDREALMQRIQDIDPAALDDAQKQVYDAIVSGPRHSVRGPLPIWLHSPRLADRAQSLGAYCRFGSSLERRLSELAILVTGAHWQARFEWYAHAPIGVEAGLDPQAVEAIRKGETPHFARADEAAVYAFAQELVTTRRVSDASYQQAEALLGARGLVDLVGILGYYALVSMTLVTFDVPLPAGVSDPFEN
jgi:4-carboxymuconolactone decarboxylase